MVEGQVGTIRKRFRLDNAANVYPAIRSRKLPGLFRVSATLTETIDPDLLQQALNTTLKRMPSFSVRMRSGLFWHYFSHSDDQIHVQEDVINPCMSLSHRHDKGFQIRVRYHDRRVALEVFHSVTDGSGAMVFLKTMIAQYLRLKGIDVPPTHGILNCNEAPRPGEFADEFRDFAGDSTPKPRQEGRAYHVSGTKLSHHDVNLVTGTLPIDAVRAESRRHGVSITEYLTSVCLYVLQDIQQAEHSRRPRVIRVEVPVNLHQFYPTETLRNFSSYVGPSIDPNHGTYTFEEILPLVHHYMRYEVTDKHMRSRVSVNTRIERNLLLRMLPLFIKNRGIYLVYRLVGPAMHTIVLSNLGAVQVPSEMLDHVEMFDFNLMPSPLAAIDCAVLGYKDKLRINFSRVIEEPVVERAFFTFLVKQGIPVKVESNKE